MMVGDWTHQLRAARHRRDSRGKIPSLALRSPMEFCVRIQSAQACWLLVAREACGRRAAAARRLRVEHPASELVFFVAMTGGVRGTKGEEGMERTITLHFC